MRPGRDGREDDQVAAADQPLGAVVHGDPGRVVVPMLAPLGLFQVVAEPGRAPAWVSYTPIWSNVHPVPARNAWM